MGVDARPSVVTNSPLVQTVVEQTPGQTSSDEDGPRSVVVLSGEALDLLQQLPSLRSLLEQIRDLLIEIKT